MSELRVPTLNRVLLSGRLTRDPELRYTPQRKCGLQFLAGGQPEA